MKSAQPARPLPALPEAGSSRLSGVVSRDGIHTTWQQAANLSTEIRRLWTLLSDILDRHEDTICKRWAKKTKKKRLNTVLQEWSYEPMPETRRLDFWDALMASKTNSEVHANAMKKRYHYLMPYINQEDLCKPHILPLLLKSRGRHLPSDFAGADAAGLDVAIKLRFVVPERQSGTMRLIGFTKDDFHKYGEIVAWDRDSAFIESAIIESGILDCAMEDIGSAMEDIDSAMDSAIEDIDRAKYDGATSKQFLVGHGMLVLEVQQLLLEFLVKCCRSILQDLGDGWITNYPVVQPELHPITTGSCNGSLTKLAEEAPYRVPAKLNLEAIESLLSARSAAAKDRLWQMREDPLYFAHQVTKATGHRQEFGTFKVTSGARRMDRQLPAGSDILWGSVLQDVVNKAYSDIEMFTELKRLAREVCHLRSKHASAISPNENLPSEYLQALLQLRYTVTMVANLVLKHLRVALSTSAPWLKERPGSFAALSHWVKCMTRPENSALQTLGLPLAVELLGMNLQDKAVPSHVEEYISDLSILSQCIEQLDLYHPWSRTFKFITLAGGDHFHPWDDPITQEEMGKEEWSLPISQMLQSVETPDPAGRKAKGGLQKAWMTTSEPWADRTVLLTKSIRVDKHVPLLKPFTGTVRYPIDKAPTEENTKALRLAESNLDALWASIDDILGSVPQLGTMHALQRTPEWVQPEVVPSKKQSKKVIKDVKFNPMPSLQETSTSHFQHALAADGIQRTTPKIKTRGTAGSTETSVKGPDLPLIPTEPLPAPPLVIPVGKIPLKVFRTLFFTPNVRSTPGEISWTDFIRAMTEAGFSEEQRYGSVWQFQPRELDFNRSILFHAPHPVGKIPYYVARRFGRRLTRAYGWNSSTFVPK